MKIDRPAHVNQRNSSKIFRVSKVCFQEFTRFIHTTLSCFVSEMMLSWLDDLDNSRGNYIRQLIFNLPNNYCFQVSDFRISKPGIVKHVKLV